MSKKIANPTVIWEEVKSEGYSSGNRMCHGRGRVPGGWIYEFSRWDTPGHQPFAVFVPDPAGKA